MQCEPTTYYRDSDGDGYGDSSKAIVACTMPVGYVKNKADCDDTNSLVHRALHSGRRLKHHITIKYGNETGARRLGGTAAGGIDRDPRALNEYEVNILHPALELCSVCGFETFACSRDAVSWDIGLGDGVREFIDPTPGAVCAINATVFGTCGFTDGISVSLNENTLGTVRDTTYICACNTCLSGSTGFIELDPNSYVAGGENTIKVVTENEACIDRVELDLIECSCPL